MPSPRSLLASLLGLARSLVAGPAQRRAIAELEAKVGGAQAQRIAGRGGRVTEEVRGGMRQPAAANDDRPPAGEDGSFLEVSGSSNVHSFSWDPNKLELFVRFLADGANGTKSGPGPMYKYSGVGRRVWERFKFAGSKGGAVWDELRIRGTAFGHKFDYQLAATGPDLYVPRKQTGVGLNPREVSQDGRILRSSRPGTGRFNP